MLQVLWSMINNLLQKILPQPWFKSGTPSFRNERYINLIMWAYGNIYYTNQYIGKQQ